MHTECIVALLQTLLRGVWSTERSGDILLNLTKTFRIFTKVQCIDSVILIQSPSSI